MVKFYSLEIELRLVGGNQAKQIRKLHGTMTICRLSSRNGYSGQFQGITLQSL